MSLLSLMAITPVTAPSVPDYLAGSGTLGTWTPTQLFAGEADIVTDSGIAAADIAMYQVIAKNAAGKFVPHAPSATDGTQTAIGIALQPTKNGNGVQYYTGGCFNHAALGWDSTLDTFEKRQAVFDRTNIQISKII